MNELQYGQLKQAVHPVVSQLTEKLIWQPDQRFDAVVTEVPRPLLEQVRKELAQLYPHQWDKKTIRQAPHLIRRGAGLFAQMENSQVLFTNQGSESEQVMAAWWPWGPDAPVSLRLFKSDVNKQAVPLTFIEKVKALFN